MVLIHRERVEELFLEVYEERPFIRFRDIRTGRYVKRPEHLYIQVVVSAETTAGKEPIEVEAHAYQDITEIYRMTGDEVIDYLYEKQEELYDRLLEEIGRWFGPYIVEYAERKGRELRKEVEAEGVLMRWRHPKRYKTFREMWTE